MKLSEENMSSGIAIGENKKIFHYAVRVPSEFDRSILPLIFGGAKILIYDSEFSALNINHGKYVEGYGVAEINGSDLGIQTEGIERLARDFKVNPYHINHSVATLGGSSDPIFFIDVSHLHTYFNNEDGGVRPSFRLFDLVNAAIDYDSRIGGIIVNPDQHHSSLSSLVTNRSLGEYISPRNEMGGNLSTEIGGEPYGFKM